MEDVRRRIRREDRLGRYGFTERAVTSLSPKKKGARIQDPNPFIPSLSVRYFLPLCPPPLWRESPPPPLAHLRLGESVTCSLGSLASASL